MTSSIVFTIFASAVLLIILALIIFIYAKIKTKQFYPVLVEISDKIGPHLYLYMMPFPLMYLFYYHFIYDINEANDVIINKYFQTISISFFSAGIFSATFKLINSLVVFKENFKKIVLSDDFDNKLTEKFDSITLSNEYLLQRSDLKEIWSRVTLCKYQQKFPQLKNSLEHLVENDLYEESSLSYYYKNFRTQMIFELGDNDVVRITEITSYKIVTCLDGKIEFDFWLSYNSDDENTNENERDDGAAKFKLEYFKINNESSDSIKQINKNMVKPSIYKTHTAYKGELEGGKEYFIERKTIIYQNIVEDPVFSFSSSRLIESLTIKMKNCDKLNIFFSPIGKNIFILDNQEYEGKSYLSNEILMPGEKFKIFIHKK